MTRLRLCLLFLVLAAATVRAQEKEYIILTGGPSLIEWEKYKASPHDHYWGNFVRASRVRIQQLRELYGPDAHITWLVYRPAYLRRGERQDHTDRLSDITSVRDKYHVKLVFFDDPADVINYLNVGQERGRVKITDFDTSATRTGRVSCLITATISTARPRRGCTRMSSRAASQPFYANAFVKSWGCHTGESMSREILRRHGHEMIGAIGKTDYSGVLDEPPAGGIPTLSNCRWGG